MQALSLKVSINQIKVEFCGLDDKLVKNPYNFSNEYLINFKFVCCLTALDPSINYSQY